MKWHDSIRTAGSASIAKRVPGRLRAKVPPAPPILTKLNPETGLRDKRTGAWIFGAMRVLAKLKGLRGTAFVSAGGAASGAWNAALPRDTRPLCAKSPKALNHDNRWRKSQCAGTLAVTVPAEASRTR